MASEVGAQNALSSQTPPREATELARTKRTERTMIRVRWAGVIFGLIQSLTYYRPYPKGVLPVALALVAALAAGNTVVWLINQRASTLAAARRLSLGGLALDFVVVLGFVFVYTFDKDTAIWALIYILPLEGAIRFQLRGSMTAMVGATIAYSLREIYGASVFGNEFLLTSISFRMGLGFLVGAVAGAMATNLVRDRRQLEVTNDRYESILQALGQMGEGFIIAEPTRILYANEAMEQVTGYSSIELQSMASILELVVVEERDAILERMVRVPGSLSLGERFETAMRRKDGTRVELEVAIRTLERQEQATVVGIIRDITDRKKAELQIRRSREQLEEAQQIAQVGSWEWHIAPNLLVWSDELYRIYDLDSAQGAVTFESFLEGVHPEDRAFVETIVREALRTHEPFAFDHRIVLPDGSEKVVHGRGEVVVDESGNVVRMLGTSQDITSQKRSEQELQQAYQREHEALSRLQEQYDLKSDFLSTVSHELRTPVTTIGGFAATLTARWEQLNDEQKYDFVGRISRGSNRLTRLIAELLDFGRLERGHVELRLKARRIADEVAGTIAALEGTLEGRAVQVEVPRDVWVLADGAAISRILENLLTNAVKFSPPGSEIRIRALDDGPDEVVVQVEDQGSGIPTEELHRVFERFHRAHRGDASPSGTGVGLAVVREFVEAQGGKVWAQNRPEGGAVFSFTLRRADLQVNGDPIPASQSPRPRIALTPAGPEK